jgi:hypothetical protein
MWVLRHLVTVASSTCQAEYMPLGHATHHSLWIRNLLTEILGVKYPIKIFCNNQSAVKIGKLDNPGIHSVTFFFLYLHFLSLFFLFFLISLSSFVCQSLVERGDVGTCSGHVHSLNSTTCHKASLYIVGWFTLGTITNFNLNLMTLVIKFSLKIWLHPNLPKHPDIEV